METTGHRTRWVYLDPRALREWAMIPLAISLGLTPPDSRERSRARVVVEVDSVLVDGQRPAYHVYVDQGHHWHRLPTTRRSHQPWTVLWTVLWTICHLHSGDALGELQGCVLVSDTGGGPLRPATKLAGLVFNYSFSPIAPSQSGRPSSLRVVSL